MGDVIFIRLEDFLSKDPREILAWFYAYRYVSPDDSRLADAPREIRERAGSGYALGLDLGVPCRRFTGGNRIYQRLIFTFDRVYAEGVGGSIPDTEVIGNVLMAYLRLREAAALARKMRKHGRIQKDPVEGSRDWTAWEHGYASMLPPSRLEQQLLERRLQKIRDLREMGERLLGVHGRNIRIPVAVKGFPPPPQKTGIAWSAGVPLQGAHVRTHLAEWLDVPAEEIVRTLAGVSREREILLALEFMGEDPPALRFDSGRVSFIDIGLDRTPKAIEEGRAVQLVAENKLELRRAAVYAAWVRDTAKRKGISEEELIRLDAMGTYGYADEKDIPSILHGLVGDQRADLTILYRTGLRVLGACQRAAHG
jgi:hypothetical protein